MNLVWSEFQPLKKVLLGRTFGKNCFDWSPDPEVRSNMNRIFEETAEDLETLSQLLTSKGIEVVRPSNIFTVTGKMQVKLPWSEYSFPNHPLMPRDILFTYGKMMVQCFTKDDNRYFENLTVQNLMEECVAQGNAVSSMPLSKIYASQTVDDIRKKIIYDAANTVKLGNAVLFSQANDEDPVRGRGSLLRKNWLKSHIKDMYPDTKCIDIPIGGHADGKIALLKPGVLMTWDDRWVPAELKDWTIIKATTTPLPEPFVKMRHARFHKEFVSQWLTQWIGYVDETVFDVNCLSLDEKTVVCTGKNDKVFDQLSKNGIEPIYWNFRHRYFWDGGIHCLTQDLVREGNRESYL